MSGAPLSADAVVIGGGIAGCSVALHLRRRGVAVVLLERDMAGTRASAVNFGGVRQQGRALAELPLARRARRIWAELPALIGTDGEFAVTGHLRLARSEAEMAVLETYARDAGALGLALELLGRDALRARFPWLGPSVVGGSLCAEDGQANPRLVAPAFAAAARAAGVDLREGLEVVAVETTGSAFRVATKGGPTVEAPVLVNAAGAWAGRIAGWLGEPIEVTPEVPQVLVTEPAPHRILPVLGMVSGGLYLRQIPRGNVIFGGGEGRVTEEPFTRSRPLAATAVEATRLAVEIAPHLRHLAIIRMWTGVDGDTPDGSPVVGPSERVPGLYHAFGFCGHGFQIGPAAGAVIAELIVDGRTETDISGLRVGRFLDPER